MWAGQRGLGRLQVCLLALTHADIKLAIAGGVTPTEALACAI